MTDTNTITPSTAAEMLQKAEQLSKQTHESTKWPYIAFLLGLGAVTSFGTLAMSLLTGSAFGLAYTGTLFASFLLLMFFLISTKEKRGFASSSRWKVYIGAWATTYVAAIAVVSFAHGSIILAALTSGLIFTATLISALVEVKR